MHRSAVRSASVCGSSERPPCAKKKKFRSFSHVQGLIRKANLCTFKTIPISFRVEMSLMIRPARLATETDAERTRRRTGGDADTAIGPTKNAALGCVDCSDSG